MSDNIHIVVKGENLSVIAKKYGVTLGKLIALNPVVKKDPDVIYPGMVTTQPDGASLILNCQE